MKGMMSGNQLALQAAESVVFAELDDFHHLYDGSIGLNQARWNEVVMRMIPIMQLWKLQIEFNSPSVGDECLHAMPGDRGVAIIKMYGKYIQQVDDNNAQIESIKEPGRFYIYPRSFLVKVSNLDISYRLKKLIKLNDQRSKATTEWQRNLLLEESVSVLIRNHELGMPDFEAFL